MLQMIREILIFIRAGVVARECGKIIIPAIASVFVVADRVQNAIIRVRKSPAAHGNKILPVILSIRRKRPLLPAMTNFMEQVTAQIHIGSSELQILICGVNPAIIETTIRGTMAHKH